MVFNNGDDLRNQHLHNSEVQEYRYIRHENIHKDLRIFIVKEEREDRNKCNLNSVIIQIHKSDSLTSNMLQNVARV